MVQYKCIRCGYTTQLKPRLIKHLNRKFICKPLLSDITPQELYENENFGTVNKIVKHKKASFKNTNKKSITKKTKNILKCMFCNKQFSRKDSLKRHQEKVCIKENYIDATNKAIEDAMLKLKEQWIVELDKQRDEIFKQVNNNLTQQDCHNTYNTNTINVTNFGFENISYIQPDFLTHFVNRPSVAIPRLIKKIHFDPKHPENHNINVNNTTPKDMIQVSENNTWIYKNKNDVIHKLIKDKSNILKDHFKNVQNDIQQVKQMNFYSALKKWENKEKNTKNNVEKAILKGSLKLEKLKNGGSQINSI